MLQELGTHLKEGSGKLCAGQTRVVSFNSCLVIPFELISSENFGFALPIGSEQIKMSNVKIVTEVFININNRL